jgi:hypothetical protein
MKKIIYNLFNLWRPVEMMLPKPGEMVLCYWDEYGVERYLIGELKIGNFISGRDRMFVGVDVEITHPEVTHWKYLPKKAK